MVNNRRRGAVAEREFADLIGGKKISRTGYAGPDVEGPDGTLYEVKRIKVLPALLRRWLRQMHEEGATKLAFREDRGQWYEITLTEGESETN